MKRYWMLTGWMMLLFLVLFGIAEWLRVPILTDPGPLLAKGGWIAAVAGVGLLVADVVLPIPASLVMILHGALFGVVGGTLLSLAGALGAALFGFWIGRRGGPLLARLVPEDERRRADALLQSWGDLAIVVTRPVPILAETMAILAGASPMGWGRMLLATFAGSLPAALLYALTGATARNLDNAVLVFSLVLLVAGLFWVVGKWLRRSVIPPPPESSRAAPPPPPGPGGGSPSRP
jgi:3-dehydroquinate synthase